MTEQEINLRACEYTELLKKYVALCEEIVTTATSPSPFYSVWNAYKRRLGSHEIPIQVMVYDDTPCAKATMKLADGDISIPNENCDCNAQWRVKASYLKKILENADYYKQNPAQMDWSWLQEVGH